MIFSAAGFGYAGRMMKAAALVAAALFVTAYASGAAAHPLSLIDSDQGPALGAAMHAAVAAGAYDDIYAAAEAMGKIRPRVYHPDPADADAYDALYAEYRELHDYFGRGGNDVLHRLRSIAVAAHGTKGVSE